MDPIYCVKSTGELLPAPGGSYYGQGRPADVLPSRSGKQVRIVFLADDEVTPVLLDAGSTLYLDCKGQGLYDSLQFALSITITAAPNDPAAGYVGRLSTNTTEANALLSPNDAGGATPNALEPDSVPLMAQLCWQGPGAPAPDPDRSAKWNILLDNSVRHGLEGTPAPATPGSPTAAALTTAVARVAYVAYRPDVSFPVPANGGGYGGSPNLAALTGLPEGYVAEFRDPNGIFYRYQFFAGNGPATSAGVGLPGAVRAADGSGTWQLCFAQDLLGANDTVGSLQIAGELEASSVSVSGGVFAPGLTLLPQGAAPARPTAGVTLYADAAGALHALHATGTDHALSSP